MAIALVLFMKHFLGGTKDIFLKLFVKDYEICCLIMFSFKKTDSMSSHVSERLISMCFILCFSINKQKTPNKQASTHANKASYMSCLPSVSKIPTRAWSNINSGCWHLCHLHCKGLHSGKSTCILHQHHLRSNMAHDKILHHHPHSAMLFALKSVP